MKRQFKRLVLVFLTLVVLLTMASCRNIAGKIPFWKAFENLDLILSTSETEEQSTPVETPTQTPEESTPGPEDGTPCDHANTVVEGAVSATCTTDGHTGKTVCSDCGETISEGETIGAIDHDKVSHEAKAPTCTTIGWNAYETCNREDCNYTTYVELPALDHDKVSHEAKAPTCTTIGWNAYETCKREGCNYTTYVELPALEHDKVSHEAKAPTCTDKGWDAYETCKREGCNYTTYVELPALEHDKVPHEAKAPTCTDKGWDAYETCKREGCNYTTYVEFPALEHDKVPHEAKAPTCTDKGWDAYETCKREGCNYTTYVELPALEHDKVPHEAKAPTCTDKGWDAYETCKREGCNYTTYVELPALEHDLEQYAAKAPTRTEIGWDAYVTCKREGCNHTTYNELPALNSTKNIYEAAAKLADNETLDGEFTMTGVITSVDTAYDSYWKNITVTIEVDGYKFQCYRLKGEGADIIAVGDTITVTGKVSAYNGKVQFAAGSNLDSYTKAENPDEPEVPATLAEQIAAAQKLANGAYLPYESTMTGTVVGTPQESSYTAGTWKLDLTDGTNTITLYYVPVTGTPTEGCTITVTGKLTAYNGNAQFDKNATAKVEGGATDPETPDTPVVGETITVTVVIGDYATANNWADATKYPSLAMDANITVTLTGGGNTGKYYNNGKNWRIYQSETPTITIAATEGKTIVSVKITYTVSNTGILTQGDIQIASGTVVTVNANSVTFTLGNTGTATNGQVRITSIEVVYQSGTTACQHTNTEIVDAVDATCTTPGYTGDKVCSACGETLEEGEATDALGHDYGELVAQKDATCTAPGMKAHFFCDVCDTYFDENKVETTVAALTIGIDSNAHAFGTWTSTGNDTHTRVCANDHTHVETEACDGGNDATCTQKSVCDTCNTAYGDFGDHNYGNWTSNGNDTHTRVCANDNSHVETLPCSGGNNATCTQKSVCDTCGEEYGELAKHTYGTLVSKVETTHTPDKLLAGMEAHYRCTVCEGYFKADAEKTPTTESQLVIPAPKHVYNNYVCECGKVDDGHTHQYDNDCDTLCNVKGCGETRDPKHQYGELVAQKDATCTAPGMKAHFFCDVCDTYFDENKVETTKDALTIGIDSNAHAFGTWTSTGNNTHTRVCANDHTHVETEACDGGNDATCTQKSVCDTCNTAYGDYGDHNYGNWTSNGNDTHTRVCANDNSHVETLPCSGGNNATCAQKSVCDTCNTAYGNYGDHSYGTLINEKPATCTQAGEKAHYTCSVCQKNFDKQENELISLVIPAPGHNGYETDYKCDACSTVVPPKADSVLTIEQANALGKAYTTEETYTTDKYYVTGVITDVYQTWYGNMYITNGTSSFNIYGTLSKDGSLQYGELETKPGVGDKITVYGVIGTYNGKSAQMLDGWITEHIPCEHSLEVIDHKDATCTEAGHTTQKCTKCDLYTVTETIDALGHKYSYGECDCGAKYEAPKSEATITFDNTSKRTEASTSKQVWKENGITVTNSGSVNPDYYKPIRFYKNSKVTIEFSGITKIVIDCTDIDAKYVTPWTENLQNIAGATVTSKDKIITITFTSPVNSITVTMSSAQSRANSITVYAQSQHTHTSDNKATCTAPARCTVCGENVGETLEHKDTDNHICDTCNKVLSTCADSETDNDHNCDVCGKENITDCVDSETDNDHNCDVCGKPLSDCEDAADDNDHNCDVCGEPLSECEDAEDDNDHDCDVCGKENITECVDSETDNDHNCDVCGKPLSDCEDAADDNDHNCDVCGATLSKCEDAADDNDHDCDVCGKENITECADSETDNDHNCDVCGKENITECADSETDNDHNCDVCGKENITECVDSETDNDHNCDVCGKPLSDCEDAADDNDHNCDVCGKENITDCADSETDNDHNCDVCGATLSECEDAEDDNDHNCDLCGKENITQCSGGTATCTEQAICDVCGKKYGNALNHIDKNKDNICDREDCNLPLCGDDDHIEGAGEVTTAATCVNPGLKTFKCTACGETLRTEEIAALDHDKTPHDAKAPTCTEIGWYAYETCSRCDYNTYKEIEATGHATTMKYMVIENVLYHVATCECKETRKVITEGKTVEVATEADLKTVLYAGYSVKLTADINLTSNINLVGEMTVVIDLNGKTITADWKSEGTVEVLWAKGENTNVTITGNGKMVSGDQGGTNSVVSATNGAIVTIQNGYFYSKSCGDVIFAESNGVVNIYGGEFGAKELWDVTGLWYVLDIDESESEEVRGKINVYGGTFVNFNPANHTNDGNYTNKLADNRHSIYNEETKSYTVSEHTPGAAATCTTPQTCTECNYVYENAFGHTEETVLGKEATCTATGLTAGKKCSVCGTTTLEQEEISMKPHTEEPVPGKAATCTATGLTDGKKCSVCGTITLEQEEISMKLHTFVEKVERVDATCIASGMQAHYRCIDCQGYFDEEQTATTESALIIAIDEDAHDYINHDAQVPTCTEAGWDAYETCSRCTYTTKVEIPASHTPAEAVKENEKAATCTTNGSYDSVVKCSVCGEELSRTPVTVKATGHKFENGKCTNDGCKATQISGNVATFEFGTDGSTGHKDTTNSKSTHSEEQNGYTLSFTGGIKFYIDCLDETGKSCIKLGSGSDAGSFEFTVPDNVTQVIIHVAGYKANTAKISINGGSAQTISTLSNNGEYMPITVDTSTNKTVKFTTVSGGYRAMINTIEFYSTVVDECGGEHQGEVTETKDATCTEPGYTSLTCSACGNVIKTTIPAKGHTEVIDEAVGATCTSTGKTEGKHCSVCSTVIVAQTEIKMLDHNYVDGTCSMCGADEPTEPDTPAEPEHLATFELGANGSSSHSDGSSKTSYSQTVNGYALSITGGTQFYTGARDAKGNSCLKLGAKSSAGSFSFTVGDNVTKVIIYVAGYKTSSAKIKVNTGSEQTISTLSNNGDYTTIEIDTSTTKTVSFTTVSGGYRAMINTIEFIGIPQ